MDFECKHIAFDWSLRTSSIWKLFLLSEGSEVQRKPNSEVDALNPSQQQCYIMKIHLNIVSTSRHNKKSFLCEFYQKPTKAFEVFETSFDCNKMLGTVWRQWLTDPPEISTFLTFISLCKPFWWNETPPTVVCWENFCHFSFFGKLETIRINYLYKWNALHFHRFSVSLSFRSSQSNLYLHDLFTLTSWKITWNKNKRSLKVIKSIALRHLQP